MITADDLDTATTCVLDALQPVVDQDWSVPAGGLEWDCRRTAEHLGQVGMHWSTQLAVRAETQYVRWSSRAQELAPPAGVLDFVEASGRILAQVIRSSPPEVRAFHPWGIGDPEGFAGMACVEFLVHGHDLARGLGQAFEPPADVCDRVLARLFPHYELPTTDPWLNLRWLTGRAPVTGQPAPSPWRWRATPLDEAWGDRPVPAPMPFEPLQRREG